MRYILIYAFILACYSCAKSDSSKRSGAEPVPTGQAQDQKSSQNKCFKIVNGAKTSGFNHVGLLIRPAAQEACTATWVSDNTMITAAHCIDGSSTGGVFFMNGNELAIDLNRVQREGIRPLKVFHRGSTHDGSKIQTFDDVKTDLAVLVFPDNSAPARIGLALRSLVEGENVTIVGFGKTTIKNSPAPATVTKRFGYNKIQDAGEGVYLIQGRSSSQNTNLLEPANDALVAPGDSGGPLFGPDGKLAGVVSGGKEHKDNPDLGIALFVDLHSPLSIKLLEDAKVAIGAKIPISAVEDQEFEKLKSKKTTESLSDKGNEPCEITY